MPILTGDENAIFTGALNSVEESTLVLASKMNDRYQIILNDLAGLNKRLQDLDIEFDLYKLKSTLDIQNRPLAKAEEAFISTEINPPNVDLSSHLNAGEDAFTVGPTASGADVIWTDLDDRIPELAFHQRAVLFLSAYYNVASADPTAFRAVYLGNGGIDVNSFIGDVGRAIAFSHENGVQNLETRIAPPITTGVDRSFIVQNGGATDLYTWFNVSLLGYMIIDTEPIIVAS